MFSAVSGLEDLLNGLAMGDIFEIPSVEGEIGIF